MLKLVGRECCWLLLLAIATSYPLLSATADSYQWLTATTISYDYQLRLSARAVLNLGWRVPGAGE
eukprot:537314-Rhodomonas_salina.1